jgi:hypothetical protein
VQDRRLDLDAADAVEGHRAHRPGEQPSGDDDGGGPVGVGEPPPAECRGGQGEQRDADDERDHRRSSVADAGGREQGDHRRDELPGLAEGDGVHQDDPR